jgi:sulfate transport system substrate-binding protein
MKRVLFNLLVAVALLASSNATANTTRAAANEVTLTLAGFAVPREAYREIIKLFQDKWLKEKGQTVNFKESYQGSGAQSRAVVGGFEADVVVLSIERDIQRIADAKLITYDWKNNPYKGFVANSVAVIAVRKGNPTGIKGWADLGKPGVEVITPDPTTSGGAQWNLLAAYGAALRGKVDGVAKDDDKAALDALGRIIKNVVVYDKDGRESFLTFEKGVGTAAITYESEIYVGQDSGGDAEAVYPESTIAIQIPTAVVDVYATKHGTLELAQAFVEFTYSPEAQLAFAKAGFRPVADGVLTELKKDPKYADRFPAITDLFTIEQFGGWKKVGTDLFGDKGKINAIIAAAKGN